MIKNKLKNAAQILAKMDFITNPNLEAKILLANILGCDNKDLVLLGDKILEENEERSFQAAIKKRLDAMPIAYIIEKQCFWEYEFIVSKDVLIPRVDSEILVDVALSSNKKDEQNLYVLELGVGSGCLIISILLNKPSWKGIGLDISEAALVVARKNLAKYQLENRLTLLKSDLFSALSDQKFDYIISNPPYIAAEEDKVMAKETILFEPHIALFAGEDGLEFYYHIAREAKKFLKANGKILLEIGFKQNLAVKNIFHSKGYLCTSEHKDLGGIIRCLEFVFL
jgi:release factor glutamine methyltransferase